MITGDEVERIFIDRFPQLAMWRPPFGRKVYCWDVYYSLPTFEDLEKLILSSKVPDMKNIEYKNDCDDFTLHFISEARMKVYEDNTIPYQYPLGSCFMRGDNLIIPHHMAAIAINDIKQCIILDAMDRSIRLAVDSDDIRFISV